ncbi:MAG: hypothetical protein HS115_02895 [Spirochaetales bacterium]|nr:hypothetical protein [Spirochaetales bacterium]
MAQDEENKAFLQKVLDNNWLLLALGLAFPGIFFFAWGLVEIFVINAVPLAEYLKSAGGQ